MKPRRQEGVTASDGSQRTVTTVHYAFVPSPEHTIIGHPEGPSRFRFLPAHRPLDLPVQLTKVQPVTLHNEILTTVHDADYLTHLRRVMKQGSGLLDHGDTYFTSKSFRAARRAAGAAVAVAEACLSASRPLGVSIARPPGHHATAGQALGFCLLNNVALAARFAQSQGLQRVMIVDFDVHHGNGTQDIFYDDGSVLFVSIHQSGIFPGTGSLSERGAGDGLYSTVNVPLPPGVGHEGYMGLAKVLLPRLADRFRPDLLLLSGGFDGHWSDPLAGLRLTTQTYYKLGDLFRSIAQEHCEGKVAYVQEGGYVAQALARALHVMVRGLLGLEPEVDDMQPQRREETDISELMDYIRQLHG